MKEKWPICPSFISLADKITEESADFNNDGIYYPDYIRGFLADLSHDKRVQNALSMFQVVPKNFTPLDESSPIEAGDKKYQTVLDNYPVDLKIARIIGKENKIIRIDSGTFIQNGICCDIFRKCKCKTIGVYNKTEFCYKQDSRSAIFADYLLNQQDSDSPEYKERLQQLIKDFNDSEKNDISTLKLLEYKNRIYVHYTCTVSLFEETMFPIYAKGKFVACLMLGQMALNNYDKEKSFQDFIKSDHKVDKKNKITCNNIQEYLPQRQLTNKEWQNKLDAIVDRIIIFEKRLDDKINHRSQDYIKDLFNGVKKRFNSKVKDIRIDGNNLAGTFYGALSTALTSIYKWFNKDGEGFIRMFALPMDNESDRYVPIGWSGLEEHGNPHKQYLKKEKKYYFKISPLQYKDLPSSPHKGLTNDQMEWVVKEYGSPAIQQEFTKGKDVIRVEKLLDGYVSFIIWKRHGNSRLKEGNPTFEAYKEALTTFYTMVFQCYSYIRGTMMEYVLEATIAAASHESAHFILPSLNIMESKLHYPSENMILAESKEEYENQKKIFKARVVDVTDQLYHLYEVNERPSLIFNEIDLKQEDAQIFPILYKMTQMMSGKSKDRNQKIQYNQHMHYSSAWLDKKYFDHALFNLLDNAIKYGYKGSNIYIQMNRPDEKLEVKVISYGREVEQGERIYRLFERGEMHKDNRGRGLGMFIARKIVEAHGGTLEHESKELSPLNIPTLSCYAVSKNEKLLQDLDDELRTKVIDEAQNIMPKIKEVVNDSAFVKFPNVFANRINKPTFRNIFTILIP